MKSFEEGGFRRVSNAATAISKIRPKSGGNVDSARLRSNSLSEHSPEKSGKLRHATGIASQHSQVERISMQPLVGESDEKLEKMMNFHSELSDTCVDILSTYMFANVAVKPKRMPTANFLLKNGQKASWIIGTKVVTITTSICDQTSTRGPLCDRCSLLCGKKSIEDESANGKLMV